MTSDTTQTLISTARMIMNFRAFGFWTATSAFAVIIITVDARQLASTKRWTTERALRNSDSPPRQSHAKLNVMEIFHRVLAISTITIFGGFFSNVARADEKPMMKAVVAHEYGAPEVLKFEQIPRPEPKEDEALVRVIASSVNPADPLTLSGKYAREFGTHLPLIPGYDIAGIVEKTGPNVTKLKLGDAVYGYPTFGGGWADYVTVKEWEVAAKPKSMNFIEAASVPMGALTAWQALVDVAQLQPGQTVLIHGGSGGVGSFAVQIAKARGARVIATASTANQDLLKQLGADVAVDYTKMKFEDVAKDVDAVLDPVGKETLARSYDVVKKGGIVMSLVARPDPVELKKRGIRGAGISVHPDADDRCGKGQANRDGSPAAG